MLVFMIKDQPYCTAVNLRRKPIHRLARRSPILSAVGASGKPGAVQIARVAQPGAVFGELSALLDQPHTADVRALEDSQFAVAGATLLDKEPIAMCYVAKILAQRIIDANKNVVELKSHIKSGSSSGALSKAFGRLEAILSIGGASFET
jgi:CRP-like cAMP-binding protein